MEYERDMPECERDRTIYVFDKVVTPDGIGNVIEFDPNHHNGRDVQVQVGEYASWYYKSDLRKVYG